MFDNFKESQFIAYSLLNNSIRNDRMSHAYLIDCNNNECAFDFVMSFVKVLLCDYHYSNFDNCGSCTKCERIDNGNFTEVKVIESDSLVIKKEQLLELQSDFSRTAVESDKRIYIIKDCDKMNKQASNSLLKFLEEPLDGIIAILLTNNTNKLLSTIISRCQLIKLSKNLHLNENDTFKNFAYLCCNSEKKIKEFLEDDTKNEIIGNVIDFIIYYEDNGLDIMVYLKKMWYNRFLTRDDNILAMSLMVNFYYDVLKYQVGINDYFFCSYLDKLSYVSGKNNLDEILNKISVCIEAKKSLEYNLNVNLVIDDTVVRLGE